MRKKYLVLVTVSCLLGGGNFVFAQGTWTQKANFPGRNRDWPFSFSIGNKGYVGCGQDTLGNALTDFWEYDPATNSWTQKANFGGTARWTAMGFSIGNKGYAGLGSIPGNSTVFQDFWEYDPSTNIWTQKANFGGGNSYTPVGFSIGNMGYAGIGIAATWNVLWQYDPGTNTWTRKSNLPGINRSDASVFVVGNDAYVAGGCYNANLWQYDAPTDTWTQKANLPSNPRCDAASFAICNKGYWGTGEFGGFTYGSDLWMYDPPTNTWLQKANFPGPSRDEPASFTIGNKGYIGLGGQDGFSTRIFFDDFWEYTPDSVCVQCIPAANFSSSDSAFCSEPLRCIDFTDLSTCNATSWQWFFQGAVPDTSTQQNPTQICYSTPGTYPVTLIVANGAGSDTLTVSPMIVVGGTPPPPIITVVGIDTLICSHAASYQWFLNGNAIGAATDSFYVAQQFGTYSVMITDSNGCSRLSSGLITDIEEINRGGLEIYPNPATNQLVIDNLQLAKETTVTIYNVLGEKVASALLQRRKEKEAAFDVSSLSKGLYWIEISDGEKIYRAKFIKQ